MSPMTTEKKKKGNCKQRNEPQKLDVNTQKRSVKCWKGGEGPWDRWQQELPQAVLADVCPP